MSGITTHVLDTARGRPAAGVPIALSIDRGQVRHADVRAEADTMTFAELVYERGDVAAAVREGRLVLDGDKALFKRFVRLFPLPEPADVDVVRD